MELEASEKLTGGMTLCRNSLAIFKILTAREDASIVSSEWNNQRLIRALGLIRKVRSWQS